MNDKLIDSFRDLVECAKRAAIAIGEALEALVEQYNIEFVLAYNWASKTHPKWVSVLNRTKKKRIKKKYQDRIIREYRISKEHEK